MSQPQFPAVLTISISCKMLRSLGAMCSESQSDHLTAPRLSDLPNGFSSQLARRQCRQECAAPLRVLLLARSTQPACLQWNRRVRALRASQSAPHALAPKEPLDQCLHHHPARATGTADCHIEFQPQSGRREFIGSKMMRIDDLNDSCPEPNCAVGGFSNPRSISARCIRAEPLP